MTTTDKTYLSCAETAKLIRQALKRQFPTTKFSVRSHTYAGGASIDINWTDGPTDAEVSRVAAGYAGGRFDGMIDMAYYVTSWLEEDGTAHVAENAGTGGQRGSDPGHIGDPRGGGARMVHFGADYVFTHRELSANLVAFCAALATDNGRDSHGGRCDGCGDWPSTSDRWVARWVARWVDDRGTERIDLTCSQLCAGRRMARYFSVPA